jgi:hypothetical protein
MHHLRDCVQFQRFNDAILNCHLDCLQVVLEGWVKEGILKMVLAVEAGMEDMVEMDITMAISLRVVPHMGILIYHVNLVVAVETGNDTVAGATAGGGIIGKI